MNMVCCLFLCLLTVLIVVDGRVGRIDQNSVCAVKTTCDSCLQLVQCNWCQTDSKCFSSELVAEDYCKNTTLASKDFGLSLEGNAQCTCDADRMERVCRPQGVSDDVPECSNRGTCLCGRCVCRTYPEHPTKVVMGEFCELDNFSCDKPYCNEGPYVYEFGPYE